MTSHATNKTNPLSGRKPVAFAILMALQLPAQAASDAPVHERYPQEEWGLGAGVVLGAALGGPAGAFIGGAAGNLIGFHLGTREELRAARTELARVETRQTAVASVAAMAEQGGMRPVANTTLMQDVLNDILDQGFGVSVMFRTEAERLDPLYERQLRELAQVVAAVPGLRVDLSGHADIRGNVNENMDLSERRLRSIQALLIGAGIEPGQISSQARGEADAKATLADPDGQALDRRVSLHFSRAGNLLEAAR